MQRTPRTERDASAGSGWRERTMEMRRMMVDRSSGKRKTKAKSCKQSRWVTTVVITKDWQVLLDCVYLVLFVLGLCVRVDSIVTLLC